MPPVLPGRSGNDQNQLTKPGGLPNLYSLNRCMTRAANDLLNQNMFKLSDYSLRSISDGLSKQVLRKPMISCMATILTNA